MYMQSNTKTLPLSLHPTDLLTIIVVIFCIVKLQNELCHTGQGAGLTGVYADPSFFPAFQYRGSPLQVAAAALDTSFLQLKAWSGF